MISTDSYVDGKKNWRDSAFLSDDGSNDDSDGSIPSLEFRDDSSSDDSSVGGASISSHVSGDDERLLAFH